MSSSGPRDGAGGAPERAPELSPDERQRLLFRYNETSRDFGQTCIPQLVEEQVARTPDHIAAVCDGRMLSYRELNRRANRVAYYLRGIGVGPDVRVFITSERSIQTLIGLLAILKAGGAYVPIDASEPDERLAVKLKDGQGSALLCPSRLAGRFSQNVQLVIPFEDWPEGDEEENLHALSQPGNVAYMLYTSGSTGMPKGVLATHRGVANLLCWARDEFQFQPSDVVLAVTTFCFDTAGVDLWLPLICGARTVIASRQECLDGRELARALSAHDVTFLQATPATWRLLLDAGWAGKPNLRVVCTGEAMPRDLPAQLLPRTAELWNMYGPTETTIWSTGCQLRWPGTVPIGRPIANTQVYILNERLQPVPEGSIGELYIGGAGLAEGYHNSPQLTAEKFLPDPFGETAGGRIYRTGDLARYGAGGNLECLGRTDQQVKVRGFRVEPGEIEAALAQHPSVREVLVAARDVGTGNRVLVAYVVQWAASLSEQDLRSFLRRKLPEYMLPAAYVFLSRFPLNSNGKVDRGALPIPPTIRNSQASAVLAPRNNLEFRLLKLWERILKQRGIGVDENFFDRGGDSLAACQLLAAIEQAFGVALPMNALFESPTIAGLATEIGHPEGISPRRIFPIQPIGSKSPFFCIGGGPLFRNLALHLGLDQPFLGVPVPQASTLPPGYTLDRLAVDCIQTIESTQPAGPYFLGGWSDAGILAYEIAHQLRKKGSEVALLVLFDVENPAWVHRLNEQTGRVRALGDWCTHQVRNLQQRSAGDLIQQVRAGARYRKILLFARIAGWSKRMRNLPDFYEVSARLISSYQPKPYVGRTVLFRRGLRSSGRPGDDHYGWDGILTSVEMYEMVGDHVDMFREPGAQRLAEKMRICLEEAHARALEG